MSTTFFDAGKIIAQQHCFWAPVDDFVYIGEKNAFSEYAKTLSGAKNLIFKPTYHFFGWKQQFTDLTPVEKAISQASKDIKNAMGFVEIPTKLNNARISFGEFWSDPSFDTIYDLGLDLLNIVAPVVDSMECYHSQIEALPEDTMWIAPKVNAAALLIIMADKSLQDLYAVFFKACPIINADLEANQLQANYDERNVESWTFVGLTLLDLGMSVSYVALAAIALATVAFTIANAGLLILICSTSALVFTIIGEFAKRAYDPDFKAGKFEPTAVLIGAGAG